MDINNHFGNIVRMKLFCVGCGPGDPELLTVKAVNIIKTAEVIFAPTARENKPSIALSVVERYLTESTKTVSLVFPMIKDKESLMDHWKKNALEIFNAVKSEKKVVYLTVGDPALYSTWIYIQRELSQNHENIEFEIVPGVTSMFAFAARAKMSLAEGDETVAIIPACYDLNRITQVAKCCDTLIFLKDGRYFDTVIEMLSAAGFADNSAIAIAQEISADREILEVKKLRDLVGTKGPVDKYFSIMVAKKTHDRK